eukprot:CAMPEP_0119275082 /NCGR_PEP_ID=MMETSP1329-20130426/13199_1 /TAXON_ID=114041 /ORGANISM="Genus nov. species nov., Strain RCC1024" /LENGTH=86 /DNA_ID=CAMNT_0007275441 /DNA_START=314 /DNA_END=574 /DNA_ORIENTATION=-
MDDNPNDPLGNLEDVAVAYDNFQVEFFPGPNGKALHADKTPYDALMVDKLKSERYDIEKTPHANLRRFFASIGIPFRLAVHSGVCD